MTVTYCDVTGNKIRSATTNYSWKIRNHRYDVVRGRDFSVEGLQKLENEVYAEMAKNERFSFTAYKKALSTKISELTD